MALVAPDGRWLKVNQALCGIVGYSEQEMLGLTYHDITHPDDLAMISAHATKLLAGEIATYEIEKRYVHKLGHNVHVFLSMSLVRDGNDAPLYFICQVQDISARKSAEAAFFAEQERARVTLNSIGDAVLTTDMAGNITYLNVVAETDDRLVAGGGSGPAACRSVPHPRRRHRQPARESGRDGARGKQDRGHGCRRRTDPARRLRDRDRGFRRSHSRPRRQSHGRGAGVPRCHRLAGIGGKDGPSGPPRLSHRFAQSVAGERTA